MSNDTTTIAAIEGWERFIDLLNATGFAVTATETRYNPDPEGPVTIDVTYHPSAGEIAQWLAALGLTPPDLAPMGTHAPDLYARFLSRV